MHPLCDAVALWVVRSDNSQSNSSAPAELLEGSGSELSSIIQQYSVGGAKVYEIGRECLPNLLRTL